MLYGLSLPAFLVESRRRIARRATTALAAMHKLVALSVTAAAKGLDRGLTDTEMIYYLGDRNLTFFKTKQ
jgi:hypothetical protein